MKNIAKTSPLYDYWKSSQNDAEERKRLLKLNPLDPAANLFKYEPYKWENLYQSIVRRIIRGDSSSIKGLMVLMSTLNENEKEKALNALEVLLNKKVIDKLRIGTYQDIKSKKNIFTFIIILFSIFTNPYGLDVKRDKNHIYEKTGMFFHKLRKIFYKND